MNLANAASRDFGGAMTELMLQVAPVLVDVGLIAFVVGMMAAVGMRLTVSQIVGPLRGAFLPIKALLASFVLVPALAFAIRAAFPSATASTSG